MSEIRNRFKILLAQKEVKDGRTYTYEEIYKATGVSPTSLTNYANGRVSRFDAVTITALCDWLDCELSDLLEYPPAVRQAETTAYPSAMAVPA
jgi:putative transcriptional regulator